MSQVHFMPKIRNEFEPDLNLFANSTSTLSAETTGINFFFVNINEFLSKINLFLIKKTDYVCGT